MIYSSVGMKIYLGTSRLGSPPTSFSERREEAKTKAGFEMDKTFRQIGNYLKQAPRF
jgi:hypothetical protein